MNLTQEQVARDFFITRQTISSWENEKTYPDIISLIKLSDYYHVSLDQKINSSTSVITAKVACLKKILILELE